MNRAFLLMMVGNVAFGVWIRPDVKRMATAARPDDPPAWAVLLLIASLAVLAYSAIEAFLIPRDS